MNFTIQVIQVLVDPWNWVVWVTLLAATGMALKWRKHEASFVLAMLAWQFALLHSLLELFVPVVSLGPPPPLNVVIWNNCVMLSTTYVVTIALSLPVVFAVMSSLPATIFRDYRGTIVALGTAILDFLLQLLLCYGMMEGSWNW